MAGLIVSMVVRAAVLVGTGVCRQGLRSNLGELGFTNPLQIPQELQGDIDRTGRRVFDLTIAAGTTQFRAEARTPTWGVNSTYLGPTLRARQGDDVAVRVRNGLGEVTTLHGEHVYRGVAGLFLLDDTRSDSSGLPNRYGVDDVPLILQDRSFTDDGALDLSGTASAR